MVCMPAQYWCTYMILYGNGGATGCGGRSPRFLIVCLVLHYMHINTCYVCLLMLIVAVDKE